MRVPLLAMNADEVHRRLCQEADAERQKERDHWNARRRQERIRDWMIFNHLSVLLGREV